MFSYVLMIVGFILLIKGADLLVDGASSVARRFQVSDLVIGLTIVAVGTSLPELATSATAAYKKNTDIAVGNVVGSNIFNILFVLGISSTIKPLPFQKSSNIDIGMVIFSSILLFGFMFSGKKKSVDRWEGLGLLLLYAIYIGYLVISR